MNLRRCSLGVLVGVAALTGCFTDSGAETTAVAPGSADTSGDVASTSRVEGDETTTSTPPLPSESTSEGGEVDTSSSSGGTDETGDTGEAVDPLAPWDPPVLVGGLNTDADEDDPSLSPDLLEIYFASDRSGTEEIYVASRPDLESPWSEAGAVTGLGPTPPLGRGNPAVSPTGTTLFFTENIDGHIDLYSATRANAQAPFSDRTLVDGINTSADEFAPAPSGDLLTLVFARNSGSNADLWVATRPSTVAAWDEPQLIGVVNSAAEDATPWISPDITVMMFASERRPGPPKDLYVSVRSDVDAAWERPIPVASLNTDGDEQDPWFSADGRTIFFATGPVDGDQDLYTSSR